MGTFHRGYQCGRWYRETQPNPLPRAALGQVRNRDQANFDERIARLLQDREVYWTAPYRAAFPTVEQATIDLIVDLYETADATQRRHIDQRLQDMRRDLGSLDCLPTTAD